MSPHAVINRSISAPAVRRCRKSDNFVPRPPLCEQLEERLAFALFTVQPPLTFSGLNNNNCVAVGDFNKDGLNDAVLSNFGTDYGAGAGTTISVLYRTVAGGFTRTLINTSGANTSFVSVADINGDTWPDIIASNANHLTATGTVSVFQNNGAGGFALVGTPFSAFGYSPAWVGLADMTGDNILDVIVANTGKDDGTGQGNVIGNNVTVFQGNSDGAGHGNFTFSLITTLAPGSAFTPNALAIADFQGDGIKDIAAVAPTAPPVFGQPQGEGVLYLFRGTGAGGFAAPTQSGTGGALPVNIQFANLNADTKADLVIANAGDPNAIPEFDGDAIGVLLNTSSAPGSISFGPATSIIANMHGPFAVALDDFNRDGKTDITSINYGAYQSVSPAAFVSVYLGNGAGAFSPDTPATYDTQTLTGGGQYLAVGNFDNNPTPDLIVAHATNKVVLLLNTTLGPVSWDGGGDGINWTDPLNWSGNALPGAADDVVISLPSSNPTIQLASGSQSIKSLSCAESLNITGGTLSIANASQISASLSFSGGAINGAGDLTISASMTWSGGQLAGSGKTTIAAGAALSVTGAGLRASPRPLRIDGQATVQQGDASILRLGLLEIGSAGKLDLKDNDLIIDYAAGGGGSPIGTFAGGIYNGLTGYIQRAYDFGAWDHSGLATSMPAAISGLTTLAIAEAADVYGLGSSDTAAFSGQSVDATTVVIKYTYAGDANLDGVIDGGDYGIIDNFVQVPGAAGYFNGDFNFDGVIDGGDYGIIDNNMQAQGGAL